MDTNVEICTEAVVREESDGEDMKGKKGRKNELNSC